MRIFFGQIPHNIFPHGCALTIGNFDGVHTGHIHLLQQLQSQAKARVLPTILMIFEPQPAEYFARQYEKEAPFRLTPFRDKLTLLQQSQYLDAVWVARFNQPFSTLTAQDFIDKILIETLNVKYLLIGDDFRFGSARQGDFSLLSEQKEFVCEQMPSVLTSGSRSSSSAVREALCQGQLVLARQILGHDYTLSGRVMHGRKLGREIGCPTANIHLPDHHYPLSGVFVVNVSGSFGTRRGVASFGKNPTVSHSHEQKLEVHIFNLKQDLYGQRLKVTFLHKLRDEQKFATIDELREQIFLDMDNAQNWTDE